MYKLTKKTARKSLCLYGAPVTGKTTMVADLVAAGHNVCYIDLDFNTGPFMQLPEDVLERMTYVRISDNHLDGNVLQCMHDLKRGRFSVCDAHGVRLCPVCKKAGIESVPLSLADLPEGSIVVLDSFSVVHASASRRVLEANSIEAENMARLDQTYYAAVSNITSPVWEFFAKLPYPVHSIIITHPRNKMPTLVKDPPPPYWVPYAGSVNYSADSSAKWVDAMWFTRQGRPPAFARAGVVDKFDAFTRGIDVSKWKDYTLTQAALEYFKA